MLYYTRIILVHTLTYTQLYYKIYYTLYLIYTPTPSTHMHYIIYIHHIYTHIYICYIGIDVQYFGELMTMSGLVLNPDVKWISFHSSYDFGYLLKLLTCKELPSDEGMFLDWLYLFFPCIYDVKVSKFIWCFCASILVVVCIYYRMCVYT